MLTPKNKLKYFGKPHIIDVKPRIVVNEANIATALPHKKRYGTFTENKEQELSSS